MNPEKVKKDLHDLKHKHAHVKGQVKDKKDKLYEYIVYIEEYYVIIEEITEWIIVIKKRPAFSETVSTEPEILKRQVHDVEVR